MSEQLVIWLPEDLDDAWAFYKSGDEQGWAADEEERKNLARLASGGSVVVCPGTWFRTFPHSLPEMKVTERVSAAGYAIEERLAAPLDEQHIVLGKGDDQRVGVVNRDLMSGVMARLDDCNIVPSSLIAEYEAFSMETDTLAVWGRTIHPGPMGYAMDGMTEGENPLSLIPQMQFSEALDYAQGSFTRRSSRAVGTKEIMGLVASVLLALVGWLGWQWSDARATQQQATDIRAEASRLFTEATGRPAGANMIRVVERAVNGGGQQKSDFVTLSALFIDGLKQVDNVTVESLRYNETRGALTVKMIYPSFDTAQRLEQLFASGPAKFRAGSVRDQKGQLIGEGEFSMGDAQ